MKNKKLPFCISTFLVLLFILLQTLSASAQCANVGFEDGTFTSWTGMYGGTTVGFDQAANDAVPSTNKSHCIMTGGFDATLGGNLLPQVCPLIPGNTRSMRLGNQAGGSNEESITYTFTVDQNNSNFTYYYAVVLDNSAPHTGAEQPYFKITMTDANNAELTCAKYDINATTGKGIPGFTITPTSGSTPTPAPIPGFTLAPVGVGGGGANWKNWSAVTIPLATYMNKTVKIKFETRDCHPGAIAGSHWAYAYVDASCSPLEVLKSSESVCPGQTVTLVAPSAQAYSWKGPSPGSIVSGASTATVTVNAEGTYTVTLTAFGDAACTYTLTANMAPFLPGSGVLVNSTTICAGGSATLTASGGAPYTWSTGASTPSITVTPASTTTYSVSGGTCPSTNSGTVTVNQIPTSPFTVTSVCANTGSTITYTGNAPGTATYTWDFTGSGGTVLSGSGQGPYSVSWPTSGSKAVTLQVTNGPCPSPVTTNNVTINPAPILTITASTICAGVTGTLAAAGASTYAWSDNSTAATLTSPILNASTSYTVTGSALGCSSTASGTITVNQLQNAAFSYPAATVCKSGGGGDPTPTITGISGGTFSSAPAGLSIDLNTGVVTLAASALGNYTINYTTPGPCPNSSTFLLSLVDVPVADFSYGTYCKNVTNPLPTFLNSGSAGTFSSTGGLSFVSTSTGEINLATSTSGNYTITNSINSAGCPLTTFTNTITINAVPTVTVNNPTACSGAPAIITAAGAINYTWPDNSTANTLSVSPNVTTPYTVIGESNGCTSSATSTVTVNAKPNVTVPSKTICAGSSTAIYPSGASTYSWSNGTSLDSLVVTTPASDVPFSVVGTTNGCSATAIGNVTVNALPTVKVANQAICQGASAILMATGGITHIWIAPGGVFFLGNPYTVTPTAAVSSYTVIGTTANCNGLPVTTPAEQQIFRTCFGSGCSAMDYPTVTVNPVPTATFTTKPACIGQAADITFTGVAPANATYNWNFNGGVAVPGTGQGPHKVTWPAAATYNISLTVSLGTCTSQPGNGTVTINALPTFTVSSPVICQGEIATPVASNNALTYKWPDGTSANATSVSPLLAKTTYSVTGTDVNKCSSVQTYTIIVNPLPDVTSSNATICKGQEATLTASGATLYVWSNNTTGNILTASPTEDPTEYTVTGTDLIGCEGTAVGRITVISIPKAEFNVSPDPAFVTYPTITFSDQSSKNVTYWKWDFGDGDTLSNGTTNPEHTYPAEEATYTVSLTVKAGLCGDQKTREVVIGPEFSFYMPNAFSPNGDGDNDLFFGKGKGILEYKLMIFDRWGNFIFLSEDLNTGWDGKANGGAEFAQQDIYVWKVELMDVFKKKRNFIGTVSIVHGK